MSGLEQHPAFTPGTTLREFCFHGRPAGGRNPAATMRGSSTASRSLCRELGLADLEAPVDALSGGMLRKASLARCLSRGARFLTLDEPTNHLDLETIEWLEALLRRASFGFIVVTHDRYFLDAVCTAIMEIDGPAGPQVPGRLRALPRAARGARGGAASGRSSAGSRSCAASWNG